MFRRTKIVATLGPATDDKATLKAVLAAGVNVVRLNFSHGIPQDHIDRAENVREIAKELGIYVGILGDLQGPKIRVGKMKNNGVELINNHELIFTTIECLGDDKKVYISYQKFPKALYRRFG